MRQVFLKDIEIVQLEIILIKCNNQTCHVFAYHVITRNIFMIGEMPKDILSMSNNGWKNKVIEVIHENIYHHS